MERDGKKRVVVTPEEGEQDDEEKIEKFFEIIGRLREARFATKCLHEPEASVARKKMKVHKPVWTPTFEMEDFVGLETDSANINLKFSFNEEHKTNEKEGEEKGLDLNLSL
ncbi:hypothetical protein FNV43_RR05826 [Rhamnella rubrinervis]|uniref:NIM1-interacting protein n=1 Tax=Rhamnella rubrinervis TaxID=2594499 RepID=A0A8K0MRZ9_9ROSA|nr:hypothetical protein FNV43_RR05826 [Rhamnella rubrinervis]